MAPRTSRVWRSLLANHGREMIEVSVAISILVGLALIMHQQWRIAEDVREVLGDIRTTRGDIGTSSPEALPAIRETYDGGDIARHAFRKELTQEERVALERQAAALIASHDLPAALDRYEALAAHFPDDGTFGDVITVLRAKLRCERSAGLGSGACR